MKINSHETLSEIWKIIPGFTKYEVSNLGRLRHVKHQKIRKLQITRTIPYPHTTIARDDGVMVLRPMHYYVMLAFVGVRPPGYEVDHLDRNKLNSCLSNLEYVTLQENRRRAGLAWYSS